MSGTRYPIRQEGNLAFSFISEGRKGDIEKLVKYDQIDENTFNLGFGDRVGGTFRFDDSVETDNGDTRKVMATVISTLEIFFERYPYKFVFIKGSDQRRTDFYAWIVKNNIKQFEETYQFWGGVGAVAEKFISGKSYDRLFISKPRQQ